MIYFSSPAIFSNVVPVLLLTLNMHIQHIKTSEVKTLGWCACLSALKPSALSFSPRERGLDSSGTKVSRQHITWMLQSYAWRVCSASPFV